MALYSFYQAGFGWFTGGEPGMGFYLGILNDNQARAIILNRKELIPQKHFSSRDDLIRAYRNALSEAHLYHLLVTLRPESRELIRGNEREIMIQLRRQPDPTLFIEEADPDRGILLGNIIIK